MTQPLPLLCAAAIVMQVAPSRVISNLIVTFVCRPLVPTCFCSYETKWRNCGRLQNALERRVPFFDQSRDEVPGSPVVTSALPCAPNLPGHDTQPSWKKPMLTPGVLFHHWLPPSASTDSSLCPPRPAAPISHRKK